MADPKFQQFYEKIRNHQGAVDAMMKVGEVMKSKGGCLEPKAVVHLRSIT